MAQQTYWPPPTRRRISSGVDWFEQRGLVPAAEEAEEEKLDWFEQRGLVPLRSRDLSRVVTEPPGPPVAPAAPPPRRSVRGQVRAGELARRPVELDRAPGGPRRRSGRWASRQRDQDFRALASQPPPSPPHPQVNLRERDGASGGPVPPRSGLPTLDRRPRPVPVPDASPGFRAGVAEIVTSPLDTVRDVAVALANGVVTTGEAAVGLGSLIVPKIGELSDAAGYDPQFTREWLSQFYSEKTKQAQHAIEQAGQKADGEGLRAKVQQGVDVAVAALNNPRIIGTAVVESLPLMLGGGAIGRSLVRAVGMRGVTAGAVGEGAVSAGVTAEGFRQAGGVEGSTLGQQALAVGSGIATGLIGRVAAPLARKLGVEDVDTLIAAGVKDQAAARSIVRATILGAVQEGVVEELPQSVQEQIASNIGQGRDPWEDVPTQAVLGMLAGAVMGGGVQQYQELDARRRQAPAQEPEAKGPEPSGEAPTPEAPPQRETEPEPPPEPPADPETPLTPPEPPPAPPEPPEPPGQRRTKGARAPQTAWTDLGGDEAHELRRILTEMDTLRFVPKTLTPTERGRGGDVEVSPGAGGAPVYYDILGGDPKSRTVFRYSRQQVVDKLRAFIEEGKRSVVSDLAVDVARRRVTGSAELSRPSLPPEAGGEVVRLPRREDLPPDVAEEHERFSREVERDSERFQNRYRDELAKIAPVTGASIEPVYYAADRAKRMSEKYRGDPGSYNEAVTEAARHISSEAFRRRLAEPTVDGEPGQVVFTSGGTGSGKTSGLVRLYPTVFEDSHAVLDSTLRDLPRAKELIDAAVAAGHKVQIVHVHRDPVSAWRGVVKRQQEIGRPVPLDVHLDSHRRAYDSVLALEDLYSDNPNVEFEVIDNRAREDDIDWLEGGVAALEEIKYDWDDVRRKILENQESGLIEAHRGPEGPRGAGAVSETNQTRPEARRQDARDGQEVPRQDDGGDEGVPREGAPGRAGEDTAPPDGLDPSGERGGGSGSAAMGAPTTGAASGGDGTLGIVGPDEGRTPEQKQTTRDGRTLRPIEAPELVAIARHLIGTPRVVRRFRKPGKLGEFGAGALGGIKLKAELFEPRNERALTAVLAHEIGHLVDFLPTATIKRGNLLGRIATLRKYLRKTFTLVTPQGEWTVKDPVLREELLALSKHWRPWPDDAPQAYHRYRKESKELYADAISVLLNDPKLLEERAPTFFRALFDALDRKPSVQEAYFELQDLMAGDREVLVRRRRERVQQSFARAHQTKARLNDAAQRRRNERKQSSLWVRLQQDFLDTAAPIFDVARKAEKAGKTVLPEQQDPRTYLNERNYLGAQVRGMVSRLFVPIHDDLVAAGIPWDKFGEAVLYERVIAGDRSKLANPDGLTKPDAQERYQALQASLSDEQRGALAEAISGFHGGIQEVQGDAFEAGLYTDALHRKMADNPAYATFRAVEHLDKNLSSTVKHQIGMLGDVDNPATATVLKLAVTMRHARQNELKQRTVALLRTHDHRRIKAALTRWNGRRQVPVESTDPDEKLITYLEGGKLQGVYVDRYIADAVNNDRIEVSNAVLKTLNWTTHKVFAPAYITLNLGFTAFNVFRDAVRAWQNTGSRPLRDMLKNYIKAHHLARVRAFGTPEKLSPAYEQAVRDFNEAQEGGIFGLTFNELMAGQADDKALHGLFSSWAPWESAPERGWWEKRALLRWIDQFGRYVETLPKAAEIQRLRESTDPGSVRELTDEERHQIRTAVGSPDFLASGRWTPALKLVFIFANPFLQAWRTDLQLASSPKTATGWWWRMAKSTIGPKLLLRALYVGIPVSVIRALAGGDDADEEEVQELKESFDEYSRMVREMPEYYLTNYTLPLPIGRDENGKMVFVTIPTNEMHRFVGGLTWKLLSDTDDETVLRTFMETFDYGADQAPGFHPVLEGAWVWSEFLRGENPTDPFRGYPILTANEWAADDHRSWKRMAQWTWGQIGGGIIKRWNPYDDRPQLKGTVQEALEAPLVGNVVGRFVRVSSGGAVELYRDAARGVRRDEASRNLDEEDQVGVQAMDYLSLTDEEQTPGRIRQMAREAAKTLYPDDRRQQRERFPALEYKLRRLVTRAGDDSLAISLQGAGSTAERVAMLQAAHEVMGADALQDWMRQARRDRLVSAELLQAYRRATRDAPEAPRAHAGARRIPMDAPHAPAEGAR